MSVPAVENVRMYIISFECLGCDFLQEHAYLQTDTTTKVCGLLRENEKQRERDRKGLRDR